MNQAAPSTGVRLNLPLGKRGNEGDLKSKQSQKPNLPQPLFNKEGS